MLLLLIIVIIIITITIIISIIATVITIIITIVTKGWDDHENAGTLTKASNLVDKMTNNNNMAETYTPVKNSFVGGSVIGM